MRFHTVPENSPEVSVSENSIGVGMIESSIEGFALARPSGSADRIRAKVGCRGPQVTIQSNRLYLLSPRLLYSS